MIKWMLAILRAAVGLLVMKTGIDLLAGNTMSPNYPGGGAAITGIFMILLGFQIVAATLLTPLQKRRKHKSGGSPSPS